MIGGEALAFAQVVAIDVALAGDNAIAVGALAAGLPPVLRRRAIVLGVVFALVLRIGFALGIAWLLSVPGLMAIGGLLLLGIAWKMAREICKGGDGEGGATAYRSFWPAAAAIAAADISLSLDNVLGVAGAAAEHPRALAFGLVLSVVIMGVAANFIARLIERHRWIAWVGVVLVAAIGARMIVVGVPDVIDLVRGGGA